MSPRKNRCFPQW